MGPPKERHMAKAEEEKPPEGKAAVGMGPASTKKPAATRLLIGPMTLTPDRMTGRHQPPHDLVAHNLTYFLPPPAGDAGPGHRDYRSPGAKNSCSQYSKNNFFNYLKVGHKFKGFSIKFYKLTKFSFVNFLSWKILLIFLHSLAALKSEPMLDGS
jgi:hypothetical protein